MTEKTAPSALVRAGKLSFQLLLTGLLTWFILRAVSFNLDELGAYDLSSLDIRWGLLALSSLILLLAYLYSASLWGLMVREISGYEVGFMPALRVFFTANLGRYLPGKLWQIAGLAYLARGEGVPAASATGAAVLGQAFSLAGATLVGAGVLLKSGRGPDLGGGWTAALVITLLVVVTFPSILKALLALWFRMARQKVPGGFRPDPAFGVRWMGLYGLGWILQGLAFWVLVRSLSADLALLEGLPAFPAAYVAGYLALFAPAGVGIRESLLVVFLGPELGRPEAAVVALIARLWTTVIEMVPALVLAGGYLKGREEGGEESV